MDLPSNEYWITSDAGLAVHGVKETISLAFLQNNSTKYLFLTLLSSSTIHSHIPRLSKAMK